MQPQWAPDGRLFYISDRSGWWNIYVAAPGEGEPAAQAGHALTIYTP